jgi:ankyrin repeat protein
MIIPMETLLHEACRSNNEVILLLQDNTIDINAQNEYGWTALHIASYYNRLNIFDQLINDNRININIKNKEGYTARDIANKLNNTYIVSKLDEMYNLPTKMESDEKLKMDSDEKLLQQSCEEGNLERVKSLIKDDSNLSNLLIYSVDHLDIFKYLIDKGADINRLIHYLCYINKLDIVKYLIKKGANIEHRNEYGWTPLFKACKGHNSKIVKYLVKKGANINAKSDRGDTSLHYFCESYKRKDGDLNAVKLLIDNGADINAKNKKGYTPLHIACLGWNFSDMQDDLVAIVKYLIDKGADINAKDNDGETPLDKAIETHDKDIIRLLINNNAV